MKKTIAIFLAVVMCISLAGCKSKAQKVDDMILSIGEITLDSEETLAEVRDAYSQLDDEDKAAVENYTLLEDLEREFLVLSVENQISQIGKVTLDSEEAIESARSAYDDLDEIGKQSVDNYSVLEEVENELKVFLVPKAIENCKEEFKNYNFDEGLSILREYKDIMTDEELLECMEVYGQWYIFTIVERNLIDQLKNPSSYSRVGGESTIRNVQDVYENDDYILEHSTHYVSCKIQYQATNSFGGYVTQNYSDLYFFTINLDTLTLDDIMSNKVLSYTRVMEQFG